MSLQFEAAAATVFTHPPSLLRSILVDRMISNAFASYTFGIGAFIVRNTNINVNLALIGEYFYSISMFTNKP